MTDQIWLKTWDTNPLSLALHDTHTIMVYEKYRREADNIMPCASCEASWHTKEDDQDESSKVVTVPFPPVFLPIPGPPFRFHLAALSKKDQTLLSFLHGSPPKFTFRRPGATAAATIAILRHHFNIKMHLPPHFLVPPVPSRLQYLYWALCLLKSTSNEEGNMRHAHGFNLSDNDPYYYIYDIGTGASCIFPLLGCRLLPPSFHFFATELSQQSLDSARHNIIENGFSHRIQTYRPESSSSDLLPTPLPTPPPLLVVCNPPFYDSEDSIGSRFTRRRQESKGNYEGVGSYARMSKKRKVDARSHELVTSGGEVEFIRRLASMSSKIGEGGAITWWTSLIGKKKDIPSIKEILNGFKERVVDVRFERVHWEGRIARWAVAWRVK